MRSAKLKIRVVANYACIKSIYFPQNIEVGDIELEIHIGPGCTCINSA